MLCGFNWWVIGMSVGLFIASIEVGNVSMYLIRRNKYLLRVKVWLLRYGTGVVCAISGLQKYCKYLIY